MITLKGCFVCLNKLSELSISWERFANNERYSNKEGAIIYKDIIDNNNIQNTADEHRWQLKRFQDFR